MTASSDVATEVAEPQHSTKASDLFVRCIEAEGVSHIFGVPGEENADLMMSLIDSDIEFVLCRHELLTSSNHVVNILVFITIIV